MSGLPQMMNRALIGAIIVFSSGSVNAQNVIQRHKPLDMACRQIMLDDRTVVKTESVRKVYPPLQKGKRIVLKPTEPWETAQNYLVNFGTVLFDPDDRLYKMWYQVVYGIEMPTKPTPYTYATCYAESKDGLTWTKPHLHNVDYFNDGGKNNIVIQQAGMPHVFLDASQPGYRFRFYFPHPHRVGFSKDGKSVENIKVIVPKMSIPGAREMLNHYGSITSDNLDITYDSLAGVWRGLFKTWTPLAGSINPTVFRRSHAIATSRNGIDEWQFGGRILGADLADDEYVRTQRKRKLPDKPAWAEMYCCSIFRYEGVLIGLPLLLYQLDDLYLRNGEDAEVFLTWSYDGLNWHRPRKRRPLLPNGPDGGPDDGFLTCMTTAPIRRGKELWLYYTANPSRHAYPLELADGEAPSIRLGKLRLDGWAGYEAGVETGVVTSELFKAAGILCVNADCGEGELRVEVVEVLDTASRVQLVTRPIEGFELKDAIPITGNVFNAHVRWKHRRWQELEGKHVQLRFHLRQATIFAFATTESPLDP